jgi:hypothetical protein
MCSIISIQLYRMVYVFGVDQVFILGWRGWFDDSEWYTTSWKYLRT